MNNNRKIAKVLAVTFDIYKKKNKNVMPYFTISFKTLCSIAKRRLSGTTEQIQNISDELYELGFIMFFVNIDTLGVIDLEKTVNWTKLGAKKLNIKEYTKLSEDELDKYISNNLLKESNDIEEDEEED